MDAAERPATQQVLSPAALASETVKTKQLEAATALHVATMETTFWQSIKDSRQPAELEAYLERYPDGHFATLARSRIAALKAPKPAPTPPPKPVAPPPPPQAKPAAPPPASEARCAAAAASQSAAYGRSPVARTDAATAERHSAPPL